MIVRRFSQEYTYNLLGLIKCFMEESQWGWTYNEKNCVQTIFNYASCQETSIIVVIADDGHLCGFAMLAYDVDFSDKKVGYISKFYISPTYRKTTAARKLTRACCGWFDEQGCVDSFVTCTANIGQNTMFGNLMAKHGFSPCGQTMVRHNEQIQKNI